MRNPEEFKKGKTISVFSSFVGDGKFCDMRNTEILCSAGESRYIPRGNASSTRIYPVLTLEICSLRTWREGYSVTDGNFYSLEFFSDDQ